MNAEMDTSKNQWRSTGGKEALIDQKTKSGLFSGLHWIFENIYQNRKCLTDFIKNLQGGFSSGYPDQILNELNTLDSYPGENRYFILIDTKCFKNHYYIFSVRGSLKMKKIPVLIRICHIPVIFDWPSVRD